MDVLQLGRATLVMIITVIVAVIVIAIAFPFHQEIEAFFRQTLPAWLQANPWVQWVFSGVEVLAVHVARRRGERFQEPQGWDSSQEHGWWRRHRREFRS